MNTRPISMEKPMPQTAPAQPPPEPVMPHNLARAHRDTATARQHGT
jgi:hypothetical protein